MRGDGNSRDGQIQMCFRDRAGRLACSGCEDEEEKWQSKTTLGLGLRNYIGAYSSNSEDLERYKFGGENQVLFYGTFILTTCTEEETFGFF